jgi:hypothetical protein
VLGGDVRPGLAAREQSAVYVSVVDALVAQGERDRRQRLRRDDRAARERGRDSPLSAVMMALVGSCAIRVSRWA